jgi:hypothetical protein
VHLELNQIFDERMILKKHRSIEYETSDEVYSAVEAVEILVWRHMCLVLQVEWFHQEGAIRSRTELSLVSMQRSSVKSVFYLLI